MTIRYKARKAPTLIRLLWSSWFRQRRLELGLSLAGLARQLGVSPHKLLHMETRLMWSSPETIVGIIQVLGPPPVSEWLQLPGLTEPRPDLARAAIPTPLTDLLGKLKPAS